MWEEGNRSKEEWTEEEWINVSADELAGIIIIIIISKALTTRTI